MWLLHQPAINGSPTWTSVPVIGQAGEELAEFNMSEFLGTSSSHSEECHITFPEKEGNERTYVDEEINMITMRIEFLQGMVNSPFRNTPTLIINRRGRSQDSSNEERENIPPQVEPR
jgi:hypothetical protein